LTRDIENALERAQRLGEQQEDVQQDVDRLTGDPAADRERLDRVVERKDDMAAEAQDLERQLTGLARDARDDQPEAAQQLRDVARAMRDGRVADKILYSRGVVQGRSPEYARDFEEQIEQDLDHVEEGIREALGAVGESRAQRLERSLEETRDLARALESLEGRLSDAAEDSEAASGDQPGQAGAPPQPGGVPRGGTRGQISPDQARQFQQELGRRRGELRELRERLTEEGIDVERLDEIAGGLRTVERLDIGDPRGLALLQESVIAGLKEFEFALRRALFPDDAERYFTDGAEEVPPQYRDLVEEYYRSLSRGR
jgi:DNA repair exonuclease SbcCD ATPase subunit